MWACFIPDSAPPAWETGDSEPVLAGLPNRRGLCFPTGFGGNGPFHSGFRSAIGKPARLLMTAAPLPRKLQNS